ncbi:MAG: hypothetical protein OQL06_15780 [Gammaproteobacteria bacterium]|nr:hypothetical protein [Gammaproteobacteria bacterium]
MNTTMIFSSYQYKHIRRLARWVLFVFVVSWINLVFQMPSHAAMLQSKMQMNMGHQTDMVNCHCPPPLCETVVAIDDQSMDGVNNASVDNIYFHIVFTHIYSDQTVASQQAIYLDRSDQLYRETSPPPLLLNTILLI